MLPARSHPLVSAMAHIVPKTLVKLERRVEWLSGFKYSTNEQTMTLQALQHEGRCRRVALCPIRVVTRGLVVCTSCISSNVCTMRASGCKTGSIEGLRNVYKLG